MTCNAWAVWLVHVWLMSVSTQLVDKSLKSCCWISITFETFTLWRLLKSSETANARSKSLEGGLCDGPQEGTLLFAQGTVICDVDTPGREESICILKTWYWDKLSLKVQERHPPLSMPNCTAKAIACSSFCGVYPNLFHNKGKKKNWGGGRNRPFPWNSTNKPNWACKDFRESRFQNVLKRRCQSRNSTANHRQTSSGHKVELQHASLSVTFCKGHLFDAGGPNF